MTNKLFLQNFSPAKTLVLVFAGIVLIAGCTHLPKKQIAAEKQIPIKEKKKQIQETELQGNSYYDFLVSELSLLKKDKKRALEYLLKAHKKDESSIFLKKALARRLLMNKQIGPAGDLIDQILIETPEDTEGLSLLAGFLAMTNQPPEKIAMVYKKIIKLDPNHNKAAIALAFLLEKTNKRNELIEIFEEAVKKAKSNYFLYFYLGEAYFNEKDYQKAEENLKIASNIHPERIEPKLRLIETLKQLKGNKKEIIEIFSEIISLNPHDIYPFVELSFYFHKNGDYEKSDDAFRPVSEEWNIEKKKISSLLYSFAKNRNFKKADFLATKIYQSTGDDSVIIILADIYNNTGFFEKSLKLYSSIQPDSKFFQQSAAIYANILISKKDYSSAILYLENALEKKGKSPLILFTLGNILEEIHEYEKALMIYKKGVSLNSDKLWSFYYRLGVVSDKTGQKEKTLEYMKKSLELKPNNPDTLNYIGYTYAEMGINLEQAEDMILKALSLKPNDGYITDSLGWVYYKMGNKEKALEWLKKAYSLVDNDPVILEHLGDAFKKNGDYTKAIEFYEKASRMSPDNKKLRDKLMEIK